MKLMIQRGLFVALVDRVSQALVARADSPSDTGQYLILEATADTLTAFVMRKDLMAKATIKGSAPGLKIEEPGICAMPGKRIVSTIRDTGADTDSIAFCFEPCSADKDSKKDDDEDAGPVLIGRAKLSWRDKDEKQQHHGINCVDMARISKIEINEATELTLSAKQLARFMKAVGIATENASMNKDYTTMRMVVEDGKLQLATTNGQQCVMVEAWTGFQNKKDIRYKLPFELVHSAVQMLAQENDGCMVSLYEATGERRIVLKQAIIYGTQSVGENSFSIALADKFAKIDDLIKKLDFSPFRCTVRTDRFKDCCANLTLSEVAQSVTKFDVEKKELSFAKRDGVADMEIRLPIEPSTKEPLDLELSSRHLAVSADVADRDSIELCFSGKHSLAMILLARDYVDENTRDKVACELRHYFSPYSPV